MGVTKAKEPQGAGVVLTKDGSLPSPKQATSVTKTPPTPAKYHIHAKRIFQGLSVVGAMVAAVVIHFLPPGFFTTLLYTALGLPVGLALSFLFFSRTRQKGNISRAVRTVQCSAASVWTLTATKLDFGAFTVAIYVTRDSIPAVSPRLSGCCRTSCHWLQHALA